MTITSGQYKCWDISVVLVNGTSGEITVFFELINQKWNGLLEKVSDDEIKEMLNFPPNAENSTDLGFRRTSKNESKSGQIGFYWWFMFDRLKGTHTMYEFLAATFNSLDKLTRKMMENADYKAM